MIVDIHTHYGIIEGGYQMPLEMLLEAMKIKGVDYALISNIECGISHEGIDGNVKMLDLVKEHKDKLGCMLWGCENLSASQKKKFEALYCENKQFVYGIKIHPDISQKKADDECFEFFYSMGQKYSLPVLLHIKKGPYSSVEFAVNAARKFPNTKFILGHMDLGSDGTEALEAIKAYDNLYGDTAWVSFDIIQRAKEIGVGHKIMFGTDSPISGAECYQDACYTKYFSCNLDYMQEIMSDNAIELFHL